MCCITHLSVPGTLQDFDQSPMIASVKDKLKQGKAPGVCQACVQIEEAGGHSLRQEALVDFPYRADTVPDVVSYLDLRYSNLCNFSCRTCNSEFSSQIDRESKLLPEWFAPATPTVNHPVLDYVTPDVTKINFTGGEPLLIKENLEILQLLVDRGALDTHILITTNCSTLNPKIINLVKKFHNIHWTLSIDSVGEYAEYIRNGTVWSTVNRNVDEILTWGHSVAFNITMSAYSVLGLSEFADWVIDKFKIAQGPCEVWFHLCQYPVHLSPEALGDDLRPLAIAEINFAIDKLSKYHHHLNQTFDTLHTVLLLLDQPSNIVLTNQFLKFTQDLDRVRKQNFTETFKEH